MQGRTISLKVLSFLFQQTLHSSFREMVAMVHSYRPMWKLLHYFYSIVSYTFSAKEEKKRCRGANKIFGMWGM